jgi:hypothetical protein
MGLIIGMDEAGYGPNLGPLVITATAWEVPGHPRDVDFWSAFKDVVTSAPSRKDTRLHVADSKAVYSPARGLKLLERSVLAGLRLCNETPASFHELCARLTRIDTTTPENFAARREPRPPSSETAEPGYLGRDLSLPRSKHSVDASAAGWLAACRRERITLRTIRSEIVEPARFNCMVRETGSKGVVLSRISMALLRGVWDPDVDEPTLIIADKHGGRNRYDDLLSEITGDREVLTLEESTPLSCYRVGQSEIRFRTQAEAHLPVALASMVCKYVRELAMDLFNEFWAERVSDLKPTKGYPVDARRFKIDIAKSQQELGLVDDILWRER